LDLISEIALGPALCVQGADGAGQIKATSSRHSVLVFVLVLLFSTSSLGTSIYGHHDTARPVRFRYANLHRVQCYDGSGGLLFVVVEASVSGVVDERYALRE
jgi:hypothetical protein